MYVPAFDCLNEILRTKGLDFFIYLCVFICENNSYLCCRQLGERLRPSQLINSNMETKNYILYGPQNAWDMNYHLVDDVKKIEYLIDIDDVTDDENDENGGLYIETLINLEDIDEILDHVWKEKPYISDSYLNLLNGTKRTTKRKI